MKTPEDYLKELDLNESETELYLTLLQTGPIGVHPLTEKIGMKRTTAYKHIDTLIAKGLIIKVLKGSRSLIAVTDPRKALKNLVEKKIETAKVIKQQFPDIAQTLTTAFNQEKNINDAEIRYYKGIQGAKKMYEEALKGTKLRLYVNLSKLEHLLTMPTNKEGIDYNIFERALKQNPQLTIHEILADTPDLVKQFDLEGTAQSKRYLYKFMPSHVKLTAPGILLYDNKVAILNEEKGQVITVVLHNADYYNNSESLFDYIWSTLS